MSTHVYSLYHASRGKSIMFNFDDLFKKYELQLIKKFEALDQTSPQSISNSILAYSKTCNGSVLFFQMLESIIYNKAD